MRNCIKTFVCLLTCRRATKELGPAEHGAGGSHIQACGRRTENCCEVGNLAIGKGSQVLVAGIAIIGIWYTSSRRPKWPL